MIIVSNIERRKMKIKYCTRKIIFKKVKKLSRGSKRGERSLMKTIEINFKYYVPTIIRNVDKGIVND